MASAAAGFAVVDNDLRTAWWKCARVSLVTQMSRRAYRDRTPVESTPELDLNPDSNKSVSTARTAMFRMKGPRFRGVNGGIV